MVCEVDEKAKGDDVNNQMKVFQAISSPTNINSLSKTKPSSRQTKSLLAEQLPM